MKDNIFKIILFTLLFIFSNTLNAKVESYLHNAVRTKNIELIKTHIKNGSDINYLDEFKQTPLHLAVRHGLVEMVQLLIENNASVNTVDIYGDTPLIDSVRNNNTDISKTLICAGANRDIVDQFGLKPLNYTTLNNNYDITNLLTLKDLNSSCKEPEPEGIELPVDIFVELNTTEINTTVISVDTNESNESNETNETNQSIEINTTIEEIVLEEITIKEALVNEFEKDFEEWSLKFDEDELRFKFLNKSYTFDNNNRYIKNDFKDVIRDFFPRLLKVVFKYKDIVDKVSIEGYSSSKFSTSKDENDKYIKNLRLSKHRAENVLDFIKTIPQIEQDEFYMALKEIIFAYGYASGNSIFDSNGNENEELSRRVDFRVKLK